MNCGSNRRQRQLNSENRVSSVSKSKSKGKGKGKSKSRNKDKNVVKKTNVVIAARKQIKLEEQ